MSSLPLIGIAIVIVGFALRLRPTLVVVVAGIATGLAAKMPLVTTGKHEGILEIIGRSFVENRLMTLFVITLPAIGLMERYGLQTQAAQLIRRFGAATPGRLMVLYQLFRVAFGALGLRLGGHPTFVRPLIYPMAIGATREPDERETETIKAGCAASENYGNFYGQNLSPIQPGILLVYGQMLSLGLSVGLWQLALCAIPIATASVALGAIQFTLLDRWLKHRRITGYQPVPEDSGRAGSP